MGSNGNPGFKDGESYNCRVQGVQALEAETGTPYLEIKLIVIDGPMVGEEIRYAAYATDATKKRLGRELSALGFKPEEGASWDDLETIITGKECNVTMKAETFNQKTKLKAGNMKSKSAVDQPGGVMGRIASLFGGKVTAASGPKHPDVPF